jgi:hypothetical protein
MPEWYFLVLLTGGLALLGLSWPPLLWMMPVFAALLALSLIMAARAGLEADFARSTTWRMPVWKMRLLVGFLHLLQPLVRLLGRMQHGLGPWNWRQLNLWPVPMLRERKVWSEHWQPLESRLGQMAERLRARGIPFAVGGATDAWDFAFQTSIFGVVRVVTLAEEHGNGKQLFRLRARPTWFPGTWLVLLGLAGMAILAALDSAGLAAASLGIAALAVAFLAYAGCAQSMRLWEKASQLFADETGE